MPRLSISYDPIDRNAVLTCNDQASWVKISRVCIEHSDQVSISGSQTLTIPWWQFLSCRDAIGFHVTRGHLDLDIDPEATQLLQKAAERTRTFESRGDQLPLERLRERLVQNGFTRALTAEQERNVSRLATLPSAATFSVPGAGKTTEALAVFFLNRKSDTRLLVIAPKNAFAAWEQELRLCVPRTDLNFQRLVGGEARIGAILRSEAAPKLMLITYHQFQFVRNVVAPILVENTWVFLDESHRIKRGLDGKIANTILSISHIPDFKLILSGTPMPNATSDLVPQFGFLFPEIEASDASVTSLIQPIYVRTTKSELRLREPDRYLVPVPMTDLQRRLYRLARSEAAREAELSLRDRRKIRALGRSVIRLLQITSNPALVAKGADLPQDILADLLSSDDSPKLREACDRARKLARDGKKVVVWTTFVDNVELIARRLADLGAAYIHGGVDAGSEEEEETREWKIKNFHEPGRNWVLVANPAACGEGISLHEVCHHAIYVDRNYNAAQYLQSEDRIHRLGLPKNQATTVEILCCPDSIDESVNERLIMKARRMGEVLNDHDLHIDPISFDPEAIDDDEALDDDDVASLLAHLKEEV